MLIIVLLTFGERGYLERWFKCGHFNVFLSLALCVSLNFASRRLWRVVVIDHNRITNLLDVLVNNLLKGYLFKSPW